MTIRFALIFTALFIIGIRSSFAQEPGAVIFHITSSHTAFPDTGRAKGHIYAKVLYTEAEHYHDSTVLIIAPKKLDAKKTVDLVFWFHGWRNHVDSAASFYQLTRQFIASHENAVLILPETARDAPDGYGGKLENEGVFKALVADVLNGMKAQKLIGKDCQPGHILLGGHSGAYRVIAHILQNGQMPVGQVMLFDALYANTAQFINWLKADTAHRFSQIYTDHGGTVDESHNMIKLLAQEHLPYTETEEIDLTPQMVKNERILFIHSLHEHNDIICNPDNFQLFLENSPFLKKIR
ncbi:hypothetical protein BEL04_07245 [Mucilaginibacter sp. PPCGB 2223]|uniref:hypothetical protein n=1 Tax=Mucilaginibacter sp. PPCGB 2223 TaxID=1886027 RepID=UPI000824008E|nr:hypothetical protein [Mucilaginibacter sp. PPCGB 2223]OCX54061.1 hypothetical protein BEL04_07245 [Mucilaginibacter sp. PPCGB 2223]